MKPHRGGVFGIGRWGVNQERRMQWRMDVRKRVGVTPVKRFMVRNGQSFDQNSRMFDLN